jgi:hypothetical protein
MNVKVKRLIISEIKKIIHSEEYVPLKQSTEHSVSRLGDVTAAYSLENKKA